MRLVALLVIAAALPPESELPRAVQDRDVAALPSESQLPHTLAAPTTDAADPRRGMQFDPPPALPDESRLPPDTGAAPQPAAGGPLPLEGSPDGIPWLRLNLRGHAAPLRATQFLRSADRFCTAGDDKSVVVWARDPRNPGRFRYERTIRWQIQRAARGRIYALASAGGLLALAGHGAMGGVGEIIVVNPAAGDYEATLYDEPNGHRQVVVAMDGVETPRGPVFASHSMDGRTLLWQENEAGVWQARVAQPDDRTAGVAAETASRLLQGRAFSALVALDENRVIIPVPARPPDGDGPQHRLLWRLNVVNASTGRQSELNSDARPHLDAVAALASDAKRTKLFSVDGAGRAYAWDLTTSPARVAVIDRSQNRPAISLALSPNGRRLALGTLVGRNGDGAAVELWDTSNVRSPRLIQTHTAPTNVYSCTVSDDGEIAYSNGEAAQVIAAGSEPPAQVLRGGAEMPLRVAFPSDAALRRIGIAVGRTPGDAAEVNRVFNADRLKLTRSDVAGGIEWLPAKGKQGSWRIVKSTEDRREVWTLYRGNARAARIPLDRARTGGLTATCWIAAGDSTEPTLAAIGASSGEILLIRLDRQGTATIVRRFRGHGSRITSLAASADLRWLGSSANDATVRIWPLGDADETPGEVNRWGATFAMDDAGQLMIESIRADGPLFFRGARKGDQVASCRWQTGGEKYEIKDAAAIHDALAETPWDRLVEFELRTGRQPSRRFLLHPAWQQLVSLVMDDQGEWAYWAPSGYYDASFEGHRLFGWQINRGLDELPDFFLAAQFQGILERPDVMSQLLRTGTLEDAFDAVGAMPPADAAQTIANSYRLKPGVTIIPTHVENGEAQLVDGRLRATIRVPAGQELVRVKAFAGGVVAPPGRVVDRTAGDGHEDLSYEWELAVPSDPQILVQVVAATENKVVASDEMVMENRAPPRRESPALYFLAAAVDHYRDSQIPALRTPVAHTQQLTNLLRTGAGQLYRVETTALLDDRATGPAWRFLTAHYAEQLQERASPDDLLVIYLSGHGVQDATGDKYHFIAADAEYAEIIAGGFADCLSFDDFAQFANISCRKLVILDTCHGGAIQPMRHREIKAAVRTLQNDMLLTLAASHGAEEAVEGRFSAHLLEALAGAADRDGGDGDGTVRLDELVAYVQRQVASDSLRDAFQQTPSAGPANLLPYVAPPLTQ